MKQHILIGLVFLIGIGGSVYIYATRDEARKNAALLQARAHVAKQIEVGSHRVTQEMERKAREVARTAAAELSAVADDGAVMTLADVTEQGTKPAVLIFIKDKCPCSAAAEPYYAQLHRAYGHALNFVGVIDGDLDVARQWRSFHDTPYPILCDPDLAIVRNYHVTNSAYVALITPQGIIETLWPGFSDDLLQEMGRTFAAKAGIDPVPLVFQDAPAQPYAGCPFFLD